jgi:hypothetical protein
LANLRAHSSAGRLQLTLLAQVAASIQQALATRTPVQQDRSLIDVKGLGRPPSFGGGESDCNIWARKVENYIVSVFSEGAKTLKYAAESATTIDLDALKNDTGATCADDLNTQMYSALMALTSGEAFDIVLAGSKHGYEAWRRLHRRWDPNTVGRSGLLREILGPPKSSPKDLRHAIESLEEKMASLEVHLPEELERHVQLNRGLRHPSQRSCIVC